MPTHWLTGPPYFPWQLQDPDLMPPSHTDMDAQTYLTRAHTPVHSIGGNAVVQVESAAALEGGA